VTANARILLLTQSTWHVARAQQPGLTMNTVRLAAAVMAVSTLIAAAPAMAGGSPTPPSDNVTYQKITWVIRHLGTPHKLVQNTAKEALK
jgi:hypothetical protein